jgi:hypothetical protein
MLDSGVPETLTEAHAINRAAATLKPGDTNLSYWPHSQVVALAQLVEHLAARVERLEADKPRRGRPPKPVDADVEVLTR